MKCLDEYLKRRRIENTKEEEEETEVFKKSKLTMRSPKSEKNLEEKIDDLTRIIMEMEGKLREKLEKFFREEFIRWKTEQQEREEDWKREREKLREEVRELRRRLNKIESEREEIRKEKEKREETRKSKINKKIKTEIIKKNLEKWKEEEERQKRKRNIIIKGVDKKEKGIEEIVAELWRVMEVKGKTEEIRKIGKGDKKGRNMILVKMENKEGKIEVMRKKNKLRERTERIQDTWTWIERAMQWRLIAWEERKKGKKAWVQYGKIWMEERWWRWSEEEERLLDGDEEVRREKGEENGEAGEEGKEESEEMRAEK